MSNSLPKKTDLPSAAEVDELGALQAWLALNQKHIKREESLRKKFAAAYDDAPAEEEFQIEGEKFTAVVRARGRNRKILDYKKLFKLLTPAIFFRICSVPLGKLDAMLEESKHKGLVEWQSTGNRSVDVVAKPEKA